MAKKYIEKVSYKIDDQDIIIELSDDWLNAAKNGRADDLKNVNKIIVKRLLNYILHDSTRMYYDTIFQKCRLFQISHILAYRCDSPSHKRYMEMEILPDVNNHISIHNYLIREEPFPNRLQIQEIRSQNDHMTYNLRCSICNKLKLKDSENWVKPEIFVQQEEQNYKVIHTVCNGCKDEIKSFLTS